MDAEMLKQEGFVQIGRLAYRLDLSVWWNAHSNIQLLVLSLGKSHLIKGDKTYYLKSIAPEGETWARDIGPLQDYLEGHFPELKISFAYFRDVPPTLARQEAKRRLHNQSPQEPSLEQVRHLQQKLQHLRQGQQSTNTLMALSSSAVSAHATPTDVTPSSSQDTLAWYLNKRQTQEEQCVQKVEAQLERVGERASLLDHLQKQYQQKGSAAVFTFHVASNLQPASGDNQCREAVRQVVKELTDHHRYQISQKLNGGKLRIHVEEAREPVLSWIEQWIGGALSPVQLSRLGPEFQELVKVASSHTMVIPDEDIHSPEGTVQAAGKHFAAHAVASIAGRLDRSGESLAPKEVPSSDWPLFLGFRMDAGGHLSDKGIIPLARPSHIYVSGTTGSGKSYLGRVLVEEAALHKRLQILVLDPRNQAVGLLQAEDRPQILSSYDAFGLSTKSARSFAFQYHAPGLSLGQKLPADLSTLATSRNILSFKGMDDEQRCRLFSRILDSVFETCSRQESDHTRLLVVVEEAQNFTRKRVDETAKSAAEGAERSLERIAREGRKYGLCLELISQSIKDFSHDAVSIRQNINVRMFLRNYDRELEYAANFLKDARELVDLPVGTALVHHAEGQTFRMKVRPPYSKVFEPSEEVLRGLLGHENPNVGLSAPATELLQTIRTLVKGSQEAINLSQAAQAAGITSRRQIVSLVDELERTGVIRTRRLLERGQPRIIEWVHGLSSHEADETMDIFGTQSEAADKSPSVVDVEPGF